MPSSETAEGEKSTALGLRRLCAEIQPYLDEIHGRPRTAEELELIAFMEKREVVRLRKRKRISPSLRPG